MLENGLREMRSAARAGPIRVSSGAEDVIASKVDVAPLGGIDYRLDADVKTSTTRGVESVVVEVRKVLQSLLVAPTPLEVARA